MITNDVSKLWDHLGTFWPDFPDKELFENLWSSYQDLAKETQRRNSQIFLSKYFEYMPDVFEYRYETFLYNDDNLIGGDTLETGFNYVFHIPTLKNLGQDETLESGVDYNINTDNRIVFTTEPTLNSDDEANLYAEKIYTYNPVLWNVYADSLGMDKELIENETYQSFEVS